MMHGDRQFEKDGSECFWDVLPLVQNSVLELHQIRGAACKKGVFVLKKKRGEPGGRGRK